MVGTYVFVNDPAEVALYLRARPGSTQALHIYRGAIMLMIRDVFYCKPGKVRPLVAKMGYHDFVDHGRREIYTLER
jgi:hypothetical protein